MLSFQTIFAIVVISLFVVIFEKVIAYIKDPLDLRKFPAPSFLAATTPLWIVYQTITEKRSRIIHEQHQRLGSVIRVAPKHLIFNDPRAVKDIYGAKAISLVAKDDFYDRLAGEHHDLVLVRDRKEHSRRRKALTHAFALKTVVNMEPVIRDKVRQLIERIDSRCANFEVNNEVKSNYHSINIRRWFNLFTMDVISDMAFSLPMGFLQKGNDSKEGETRGGKTYQVSSTINSIHRGVLFNVSIAEMGFHNLGHIIKLVIRAVPPLASYLGASAGEDFENICIHQLRRRLENGASSRISSDFMELILGQNQPNSSHGGEEVEIAFGELVADSVMMMNAGSDTTAAALTSTLYLLLSNPHCLEALRQELDEWLPSNADDTPANAVSAYSSVEKLPYLRACIDETLRLRPPIAFQLPRLVHASDGALIAGHHIRKGTVVAVSPFSIHRNPDLYPEPDVFNPHRWLDKSNLEQLRALNLYTIPFSQGSRACIGRHIAIVELQILISTIVRRYDMTLCRPDQALDIFDRFNANPGPLPIRVKRRSSAKTDL